MLCATDSDNQMVRRGAMDNDDNSDAILQIFGKDTTLSHSLKLIQWSSWWNNGNSKALEELVYSCWIGLQLSYVQFHTKSGLDEDILTYQLKAYKTICNSLIEYDVVLLHDHDGSVVNHLNLFSEGYIKLIYGTGSHCNNGLDSINTIKRCINKDIRGDDIDNYHGMVSRTIRTDDLLYYHSSDMITVNISTNIPTVIARIDKNILTLAGDLRDDAVLLTKHNTLDTQQNNHMSTSSIIPCSRDNSIEIDIVSGTSITGISLASCIESNDSDENTKENSLQLRIGLPSMDITSHNATNATSSPHATVHYSRQATCVSIMPIMNVAYEVNNSTYQDGERMPNKLLGSRRLTSCYGSGSDNDTGTGWYSDNVYGAYIQIVLIVTSMISKVLDSENINTTFAAVLWNRNRKGIYNQQQWTQTHGYSMYIFLHWHVNMGSSSVQSRQLGRKLYKQWGAEKVFNKKDHKDVNRKSPCNDMTKQWLNLDGRGVTGYRTKADTRYASSSRDGAHSCVC